MKSLRLKSKKMNIFNLLLYAAVKDYYQLNKQNH